MAQTVTWWMYLLHAFTPFLAIIMLAQLRAKQQKEIQPDQANTTEPLPPLASAFAKLLTQLFMAAFIYTFWLGAHWLVFWFLNKPLYIDAYFYKPPLVIYWFPYLFGLFLVFYSSLIEPQLSSLRIKAVISSVNYLGFAASFYMVFITYLKWLPA